MNDLTIVNTKQYAQRYLQYCRSSEQFYHPDRHGGEGTRFEVEVRNDINIFLQMHALSRLRVAFWRKPRKGSS